MVAHHVTRDPFENLDVLLSRPILLEPASLKKLIRDRRGGYCFEQNGLFLLVLAALGFQVRRSPPARADTVASRFYASAHALVRPRQGSPVRRGFADDWADWADCRRPRHSDFSERERATLAWTEAVTRIADTHVPDDVYKVLN
ncbi:MAG: arylamine N-acetyltransferase [Planctomycetia bacterium]|nr:arylamine N-acetyltransferase [Planctomycetia bacterium]